MPTREADEAVGVEPTAPPAGKGQKRTHSLQNSGDAQGEWRQPACCFYPNGPEWSCFLAPNERRARHQVSGYQGHKPRFELIKSATWDLRCLEKIPFRGDLPFPSGDLLDPGINFTPNTYTLCQRHLEASSCLQPARLIKSKSSVPITLLCSNIYLNSPSPSLSDWWKPTQLVKPKGSITVSVTPPDGTR